MARKYLIPFLSVLISLMLGYSLQSHAPSWKDFFGWTGLSAIVIGVLEIFTGLILLVTPKKILAKELLITGGIIVLIGAVTCTFFAMK